MTKIQKMHVVLYLKSNYDEYVNYMIKAIYLQILIPAVDEAVSIPNL